MARCMLLVLLVACVAVIVAEQITEADLPNISLVETDDADTDVEDADAEREDAYAELEDADMNVQNAALPALYADLPGICRRECPKLMQRCNGEHKETVNHCLGVKMRPLCRKGTKCYNAVTQRLNDVLCLSSATCRPSFLRSARCRRHPWCVAESVCPDPRKRCDIRYWTCLRRSTYTESKEQITEADLPDTSLVETDDADADLGDADAELEDADMVVENLYGDIAGRVTKDIFDAHGICNRQCPSFLWRCSALKPQHKPECLKKHVNSKCSLKWGRQCRKLVFQRLRDVKCLNTPNCRQRLLNSKRCSKHDWCSAERVCPNIRRPCDHSRWRCIRKVDSLREAARKAKNSQAKPSKGGIQLPNIGFWKYVNSG